VHGTNIPHYKRGENGPALDVLANALEDTSDDLMDGSLNDKAQACSPIRNSFPISREWKNYPARKKLW
jgi:hypothetical protein